MQIEARAGIDPSHDRQSPPDERDGQDGEVHSAVASESPVRKRNMPHAFLAPWSDLHLDADGTLEAV